MRRLLVITVLLSLAALSADAQTQCITRQLQIPSTVQGEITISSCRGTSSYYDVYQMSGLTRGRKLRFTLTKGTLQTLVLQLQRVDDRPAIVVVIRETALTDSSLVMDVEIPVDEDIYTLIVQGALSFQTGTYTLSVEDLTLADPETKTIPIVGHLTGAGGSEFRSDVKLYNSSNNTITGRMVFTPRNQSMSASDPAVAFSLTPGTAQFYEDVYLRGFPNGSGAARLTILPDNNATGLLVDTSTYTALPTGGELGQSPTVMSRSDFYGRNVTLIGFLGKGSERSNLFVVTGEEDTRIRWRYRTAAGAISSPITRTYAKDATFQFTVQELIGAAPAANSMLEATIESGNARVALSPVNNVSNQGRWLDFKLIP